MFADVCSTDSIKSSENTSATVICYKNDPQLIPTCSSTVDQETTSISSVETSSIQGVASTTTTTTTSSTSTTTSTTSSSTTTTTTTRTTTTATTTTKTTTTTTTTTKRTTTTATTTTKTTTTTTTTTTTKTTTTIVTTTPPCSPQPRPTGVLLNITQPSSSNYPLYDCYAYIWVATGASATLSFFFRQDAGGWMLDDVSVYHGTAQLITNGGFETGNLNAWNYSGSCFLNKGEAYSGSSYAKTGSYYYYDRCALYDGDTISQTFSTIVGNTYVISFWLTNCGCCSLTEIANVTIT
ncbi:unnamed protein product [Adineta steineri]|uniref:Uncharacterized protein n=1 Tax=Adineta steineri TaxID=433720 RepID=A0A815PVU3_9BILA|nr:unnamed protein product [Adineta steineri]CAF1502488.1 unnamed protein product [Adineta steineri]CAF4114136.1 unnamed protein product [Adineta steineri]CAF4148377.1 unnamed protein product [Adineta steineri]